MLGRVGGGWGGKGGGGGVGGGVVLQSMMATTMMVMAMMAVAGIATKVMPMPIVMLTNACCNLEHIKLLNTIVLSGTLLLAPL